MGKYKKGQNLRLSFGTKVLDDGVLASAYIGAATSCQYHGAANIEDVSTKDTPSMETEKEVTSVDYDFQTESLVVEASAVAAWLNAIGHVVNYSFDETEGDTNRIKKTALHSGYAIIKDVNVQAQNKQNATLSIQCERTYHADAAAPALANELDGTPVETFPGDLDE